MLGTPQHPAAAREIGVAEDGMSHSLSVCVEIDDALSEKLL